MTELPQNAHPTAKAFFDALDQYNNKDQEGDGDDDKTENDRQTDGTAPSGKPSMSEALRRKSQSLGWRNRNSQNNFYPVTVCESAGSRSTQGRRRSFSVRQVQRGEVEGTYGTGATVWPAAMVLIKYLERNHNNNIKRDNDNFEKNDTICQSHGDDLQVTLRGRHVIDLGGGTGVGSIAAALLGASSVVCTDGEDSVVRLARDNIVRASHQLSEVQDVKSDSMSTEEGFPKDSIMSINDCPIRAQTYWWGDGTSQNLMSSNDNNGLAILIADCVLPKLYPIAPLVQAIDECLSLSSTTEGKSFAVVSYEHRYYPDYDPRVEFRRLAAERQLDVFSVPREEMDPVYSLEDVEIWIVRRHRCPPG